MNGAHLQDAEFLKFVHEKIENFIITNVESEQKDKPTPDIIWDAFKVYMKDIVSSFSSKKKIL